jgi:hypothetical protein
MTVKSISISTPFSWVDASVATIRKDPGTMLGAAALMLVAALVPAVLQQIVLAVVRPAAPGTVFVILGFFALVNTVVFAPIVGGFFRLVHACAQGQPARATDVFALFREPAAAGRMIAFALIFMLIYAGVVFAASLAIGDGYLVELAKAIVTTPPGAQPALPPVPNGIVLWFELIGFVAVILMTAYNLGMVQAALTSRSPLDVIGDGFVATLRNLVAFLLFYLALCVAGFLLALIVGLVIVVIAVVLSMISKILAMVVIVPIYLVLLLLLYAVLFGFNYFAWRDTLGGDAAAEQQITV